MSEKQSFFECVGDFSASNILCVGDLMMDRFIYGDIDRISPEAPIPVFLVDSDKHMLGGAGNVVSNIVSLGAKVTLVSVVGDDAYGRDVKTQLNDLGVEPVLEVCNSRSTTVKTRYVCSNQQMLRVDREKSDPIPSAIEDKIIKDVETNITKVGAVILSDYGKGVLTDKVVIRTIEIAKENDVPVFVDPKGDDFSKYRGASFITPNRKELSEAANMPTKTDDEVIAAATKIIQEDGIENVLATRSEDGMTIVSLNGEAAHIKAKAKEVYDVSGAGDTVIASFAVSIAAGISADVAANIANAAGSVVVGKLGTATVTKNELVVSLEEQELSRRMSKFSSKDSAAVHVEILKSQGKTIGFANGCFDLIHSGHLALLRDAKSRCDFLIVGLNSDVSVKILKGETRPIQGQDIRIDVLSALEMVDMVVVFDEPDVIHTIEKVKPHLIIKGGDYKKEEVQGYDFVRAYGGDVIIIPIEEGHSTTNTVAKMQG